MACFFDNDMLRTLVQLMAKVGDKTPNSEVFRASASQGVWLADSLHLCPAWYAMGDGAVVVLRR